MHMLSVLIYKKKFLVRSKIQRQNQCLVQKSVQAIALQIKEDQAAFYKFGFYGAQDTLLDVDGRYFFKGCFIQGLVDFIYGNGRLLTM
ncbi:unnamed protein product [Arabis nemorensis]|uniref:pectinesterase n=1 Tax=Arabis nemorensis TaxID=586526 RepID=A0A565BL72_9BRAS|nr:unnamed protein product [Arabis nemorensis]